MVLKLYKEQNYNNFFIHCGHKITKGAAFYFENLILALLKKDIFALTPRAWSDEICIDKQGKKRMQARSLKTVKLY